MVLPSRSGSYTAYCDASRVGIGCVLIQDGRGISYDSRQLKPHEKNYQVHDMELEYIVHALKIWRNYLYNMSYKVFTDHRSLQHLLGQKDLNLRETVQHSDTKEVNIGDNGRESRIRDEGFVEGVFCSSCSRSLGRVRNGLGPVTFAFAMSVTRSRRRGLGLGLVGHCSSRSRRVNRVREALARQAFAITSLLLRSRRTYLGLGKFAFAIARALLRLRRRITG
nr:uncharacterized protein LOC117273483 [Nicotiana tomentosiformis]